MKNLVTWFILFYLKLSFRIRNKRNLLVYTVNEENNSCEKLDDKSPEIESKFNNCFLEKSNNRSRIEIILKFEKCFGKNFEKLYLILDDFINNIYKFKLEKVVELEKKYCKIKNTYCLNYFEFIYKNIKTPKLIRSYSKDKILDISQALKSKPTTINYINDTILKEIEFCKNSNNNLFKNLKIKFKQLLLEHLRFISKDSDFDQVKDYLDIKTETIIHTKVKLNNMNDEINSIKIYPNLKNLIIKQKEKKKKMQKMYNVKKLKSNVIPWGKDDDFEDHVEEYLEDTDPDDLPDESDFHEHRLNPKTNQIQSINRDWNLNEHPYLIHQYQQGNRLPFINRSKVNNMEYPKINNPLAYNENLINDVFNTKRIY